MSKFNWVDSSHTVLAKYNTMQFEILYEKKKRNTHTHPHPHTPAHTHTRTHTHPHPHQHPHTHPHTPAHTRTHTQPFNGFWSRTTQVGRYKKKSFLWILVEQGKIMEAGRVGASPTKLTAPHPDNLPKFFTGRMHFLPPNQHRQSTEGKHWNTQKRTNIRGFYSRPTITWILLWN